MQDISALEPDILERLSVYPEEMVRRLVAATPSAPPEMLIALAKDPSEEVRGRVGLNEHAPIEALFLVANDSVPAIRAALAYFRGASLPAEIFAILEADTDQLVQKMVLVARPGRVLARQDAYGDGETDGDGGSGMTGEKAKVLH